MPELGKATYTLELNTTPYDTGLVAAEAKANAATSSIAQKFTAMGTKISHSMERIGSKMTKVLTVPILAVGVAAGTMAFRFEKSMDKIAALVGVGEQQMHEYHDAVLAMVDVVGKGPKELADALYFITSAGFKGASALRVLEASAKASAAGLGETEIVADAVTSAVNAYGEAALSASRATDIMLAAVREGKAEPAEFAASIGRVIAPANLLGVSFDEVSASIAAMSLQGLDAAEATTALRGVLLTFARPTVEAVKALKSLGEESGLSTAAQVRAAIANDGLLKTMVRLKKAFGDNVEGMTAVFGNVRAFVGGQILTGETLSKNERIFNKINGTIGDTDEAFKKISETAAFKLEKAMASIEKSLVILGGTILPMAADAIAVIADKAAALGDAFNSLSPETKKLIIIIAGIAAAAGPVLLFVGALIGAITALIPVIAFAATGVGALAIGIGILVAAMAMSKASPATMEKLFMKLGLSAEQAAVVVEALATAFDVCADIIKFNVRVIANAVKLGMALIGDALDIVIGILTLDMGQAWSGLKGLVMDPLNFIVDTIKNWVQTVGDMLSHVFDPFKRKALEAVRDVAEPFSHLPGILGADARKAKDYANRELAKISVKDAAKKIPEDFEKHAVVGFESAGKKAGEGFMAGINGVVLPGLDNLVLAGIQAGDNIFDGISNSVAMAAGQLNAALLDKIPGVKKGAVNKLVAAVWDGKVWRDAQGKVLEQQGLAIQTWREQQRKKAGKKYTDFSAPEVGATVRVPVEINPPTTTGKGGKTTGGGDETGTGIIPYDLQIAMEAARQSPGTGDDLKILKQQEAFLEKLLSNRELSRAKRLEIMQELTGVIGEIQNINDKTNATIEKAEKKLVLLPPKLERRQARAAQTKWLGDDLARLRDEKQWLKALLKQKGFNAEQKQQIKMALIAADNKIKDINQQINDKLTETPTLWTAKMRIRRTKAERTDTLKDDLKVQKDELAYLRKLLKNKKLDLEQRATIMEEITAVLNRIKEINKEVADTTKDSNDEMKKLAFNIMGERAGFFATFGSNVFTQADVDGVTQRMPGSDPNVVPPSGNKPPQFARGGIVKKPKYYGFGGIAEGTGTGDTVRAMLTPGEVVLNKRQIANLTRALGTRSTPETIFSLANQAPAPVQSAAAAPRSLGTGGDRCKEGVVIEHFENVQNFEQPTPDRNREARMAKLAVESVFDSASYHG